MAKAKDDYPNDTHMLNFIGKYVTEIQEVKQKKGLTLVQVVYFPKDDDMRLVEKSGKESIKLFRECIKSAMRITDAIFNNRDWDVLGTPKNKRTKANNRRA